MRLNGNLVLNTGGTGELQNVLIERVASTPALVGAEKGRIVFNTTDNTYYYNNSTLWQPFATGGNATALQTEVDNVETSIGAVIAGDGTFNATAFSGASVISGATSITNALTLLSCDLI
jgi:hypothetical protein